MCGIFGLISSSFVKKDDLKILVHHSRQRGRDSSGLIFFENSAYKVHRADYDLQKLLKKLTLYDSNLVLGHSRLITNGLGDNQPVVRDGVCVIHNGIIVNDEEVWNNIKTARQLQIDTEVIAAITFEYLDKNEDLSDLPGKILSMCRGVVACAIAIPRLGKLVLFSNNGSLYVGDSETGTYFASESYPLILVNCKNVNQVREEGYIIDIPVSTDISVTDNASRKEDLIPRFKSIASEERLLEYRKPDFQRCTKCILPETMPYISFDSEGVCNYCRNYTLRNVPKPKEELFKLVEPYRRKEGLDCIVPFSGGRDSCYGLHLIVNELGMNPVTYTYDWGMVTDLGRRNISRMCGELGVEIRLCEDSKQGPFHMVYGQRVKGIDAPLVPFDARCYRREGGFIPLGDPALWAHEHARKLEEIDLIGGVFRLLTLLDECHIAESCRNRRGIFTVDALPESRRAVLAIPLVERHVAASKYVGDLINVIRIFSQKEVDELIVMDNTASKKPHETDYALIERFAGECFMPLAYGGGMCKVEQARKLLVLGVEKICLQTVALGGYFGDYEIGERVWESEHYRFN